MNANRPILEQTEFKMKLLFLSLILSIVSSTVFANNLAITNVSLTGQNITDHYSLVQFTLSWENSWRNDLAGSGQAEPFNWDAAWVFIKYRVGTGEWQHAWLNNTGNTSPAGSTIDVGLLNPGTAFNPTTNAGMGAFIYRNANGTGTNTFANVQLRWNYGNNGLSDGATVDLKVFAIEMVYVPPGSFYVGSGHDTAGFYEYPTLENAYQINSEAEITVGTSNGNLYYPLTLHPGLTDNGDQLGPVPAAFPKGYSAFYCMKYELSQQQYVNFLNTLNRTQQNTRTETILTSGITSVTNNYVMSNSPNVLIKNGIRCDAVISASDPINFYCDLNGNGVGGEANDGQSVTCGYLEWADLAAFLDWSGLRPMTELEFEKACRGNQSPVPREYAWGTASVAGSGTPSVYTLTNSGSTDENISANYITTPGVGNACYNPTTSQWPTWAPGPMRNGIFASNINNTGRITSGATYYGIMEMSGNVYERAVTIGWPQGRAFTGTHGDGLINTLGDPNVISWPGINSIGAGFRGGALYHATWEITVSTRFLAALTSPVRHYGRGGRGVRSAP